MKNEAIQAKLADIANAVDFLSKSSILSAVEPASDIDNQVWSIKLTLTNGREAVIDCRWSDEEQAFNDTLTINGRSTPVNVAEVDGIAIWNIAKECDIADQLGMLRAICEGLPGVDVIAEEDHDSGSKTFSVRRQVTIRGEGQAAYTSTERLPLTVKNLRLAIALINVGRQGA